MGWPDSALSGPRRDRWKGGAQGKARAPRTASARVLADEKHPHRGRLAGDTSQAQEVHPGCQPDPSGVTRVPNDPMPAGPQRSEGIVVTRLPPTSWTVMLTGPDSRASKRISAEVAIGLGATERMRSNARSETSAQPDLRLRNHCGLLRPRLWYSARRDRHEIRVGRRDVALAVVVRPPGHDRPVGLQAQAVLPARRDRHEAGVGRGDVALAVVVRSPRPRSSRRTSGPGCDQPPAATATKPAFGAGTLHWP